ncbi:MAG: sulfurtransferase TusA family protein [Acidobacteria bacterium]|nr:sulfurtransferase TusA family protein [Acidobacteriota bacterium]
MPTWSGSERPRTEKELDVRPLFNPIDCRSLGIIKEALKEMRPGAILAVSANRFQQREIQAWVRKFDHRIISEHDDQGLVTIFIEKGAE